MASGKWLPLPVMVFSLSLDLEACCQMSRLLYDAHFMTLSNICCIVASVSLLFHALPNNPQLKTELLTSFT